uniref:hypothetical protein n=1 Tax=Phytoactinopolyspora endophytica TaxID=1642495 RepID=UPI00197C9017
PKTHHHSSEAHRFRWASSHVRRSPHTVRKISNGLRYPRNEETWAALRVIRGEHLPFAWGAPVVADKDAR